MSNRYSLAIVGIVAVGTVVVVAILAIWHRTTVIVGGGVDEMIVGTGNHTQPSHPVYNKG
jgi:hypothetical protein